jgi:anaerobic selenocysteine-containing dehydrogenase
MTVRVLDGRAVDLRGDPEHRFTQGFLCAKVNRYLERVYSPERILHPMRRVGKKGEGRFTRISWDEALSEIAVRFRQVIAAHGPQAILPYSTPGMGWGLGWTGGSSQARAASWTRPSAPRRRGGLQA